MAAFDGARDLDGDTGRRPVAAWLCDAATLALAMACCTIVLVTLYLVLAP